jgi:predicted nucleic acid-binding protein
MLEIVFDACVLSNFALAQEMGLLERVYRGRAGLTDFVAAEVLRGEQSGLARLADVGKAVASGWLIQTGFRSGAEKAAFNALSRSLGWGEASSIAIAARRGLVFASDDRVARAEAVRTGVKSTGTVGILVKAVREGLCDPADADRALGAMIEAGFFSPVRSFREPVGGRP